MPRIVALAGLRDARIALAIGGVVLALVLVALVLAVRLAAAGDTVASRPGKHQRLVVTSLQEFNSTAFFDPATREPVVWYAISAAGDLQLFASGGLHPVTGERLRPVTRQVVQQLERKLRTLEHERQTDEERRAATARADAEIARARRLAKGGAGPLMGASESPRKQEAERLAARANVAHDGGAIPAAASAASAALPPPGSPAPIERPVPDAASSPQSPPGSGPRTADTGEHRDRTTRYNELVSAARVLLDTGRPEEALAKAQSALRVDPSRMAARTLWSEAQTMLDEREAPRTQVRRWQSAPL